MVLAHSSPLLWPLASIPKLGHYTADYLLFIQPFGIYGVELFFVLSGYLIGGILIKTYLNSPDFGYKDLKNFWIRRWFRTLPNYWFVLCCTILLYKGMHLEQSGKAKILYFIFLQNLWYPHLLSFFGEAWSLSVEEWFYITLPLVLFVSSKLAKPTNKQKFMLRVFIGYLLTFLLIRFVNAFHPINGHDQDAGIRKVVLFRLDAVMYGVLVAYLQQFHSSLLYKIKNQLLILSILGFKGLHYLISNQTIKIEATTIPGLQFISNAFLYLFLPLVFSLSLPYALNTISIRNKILKNSTKHISKISYSMYLCNYTLLYLPFFYEMKKTNNYILCVYYLVFWVILILLSTFLYNYIELPAMKIRDRFSK